MATGLTTLQYLQQHDIAGKVRQQGVWLKQQLTQLQQPFACLGQIRGRGLMLGLEIIDPRQAPDPLGSYPADPQLAAQLQQACFAHGLLLERGGRQGNVLRLLPPLTITLDELQIMLSKLTAALQQAVQGGRAA
jgi:diaminobutyrate-2-oxoglutarate transaminase